MMKVKNARLLDGRKVEVGIEDGRITCLKESCEGDNESIDAEGGLVIPPFFNMHFHLDSVFSGNENMSGTLWEGIERWREIKGKLSEQEVEERASVALKLMLAYGTLWVRSHVDVTEKSFKLVRGLKRVRDKFRGVVDLQLTAFPQDGIFTDRGNDEYLRRAMEEGVDNVGMIPHAELTREDGVRSVEFAFSLAREMGKDVDGHVDETDDPNSRFLEVVVKNTLTNGWEGRVTAGHVTAMHSWDQNYTRKLLSMVAKAGVTVVPNPLINVMLQGRMDGYPKRRGVAPIRLMTSMGVNVALGQDCMIDPWYPLGNGNMLQPLFMAVHMDQMSIEEIKRSLNLITYNAARAWRLQYGLEEGKPANLLVMGVDNVEDVLRFMEPPRYVIRDGRVVARDGNMVNVNGWEKVRRRP
ncbi:amidohydrolase family protein [Sulfuracidifex tepidarius]|nr:amidohydrolase family protein [Sulfuracidifex tepidarius]